MDLLHVQYVPPPVATVRVVTMVADLSFVDRPDLMPLSTRSRLRLTTRLAVARSAGILVPSSFTRKRLLACYDVDPARVHVTPEGVSAGWSGRGARDAAADGPAAEDPVAEDQAALEAVPGLPECFVMSVGVLHPRKNLQRVVQAMDRARRAGAGDLGLVLVGPGGHAARALEETIAALGAQAWVIRPGFIGDRAIAALYRRATAVVHASLYEGFGLPVLEAMAAGAAVIASQSTSIPEVAGDAALLVDPTNVAALADAIGQVAADPALRERLVAAGRDRARQFTWERCASATVAAYRASLLS